MALAMLVTLVFGVWKSAVYAHLLIEFPYQTESREGTLLRSTLAIQEGRNPWSAVNAPQDYNCYGVLFPWTAASILPSGGLSLGSLRALNLLALLAASALLGTAVFGISRSPWAAMAAALSSFGGYLYFVTPSARSDGFAALFFVAPLCVPLVWPGHRGLIVAAVLAAMAAFTKPYAAIAGGALILWLFGQGRLRAGIAFGMLWGAFLAFFALLVQWNWPGYLESTILLHPNLSNLSASYMLMQTKKYLEFSGWPLLGLAVWALLLRRRLGSAWVGAIPGLAMLALLSGWLGWHQGAFLQYYFQLLHPTAILAVAALWPPSPVRVRILEAGLVICAYLSIQFGTHALGRLATVDLQPWREAERVLAAARSPLAPALWTSIATAQNKPVYDNGQTEHLHLAGRGPNGEALRQAAIRNSAVVEKKLKEGSFDVVVVDARHPQPQGSMKKYSRYGQLCVPVVHDIAVTVNCFDVFLPLRAGSTSADNTGL